MMQRLLSVVVLLAGACAAIGAETGTLTFDDAGSLAGWTFHNGPEFPGAAGGLDWNNTEGHRQAGCLALHYDFSKGGSYVQAVCSTPAGSDAGKVRLWLKKPYGHRVSFRATDSAGQVFQKGLQYAYDGWQQVEVALSRWDSFFGGASDGIVRYPVKRFGIMIETTAEPREGALLIDDVEWLPRSDQVVSGISTYVASDFTDRPHWSPSGGAVNRLDKNTWVFAFNPGATLGVQTEFPLLGRPMKLRLIVGSEAAGTVVRAVIASHFKVYDRDIGVLNGQADQVIEVPLGDMSTWQRQVWEGSVELPLRMTWFTLAQGKGPQQGRIRLKGLEVDTIMPAGLDVLMLPDSRVEGDQACFAVDVQNFQNMECRGELRCSFRGLGEYVGEERRSLALAGRGGREAVEFRRSLQGRPFMDASFQWVGQDRASSPVSIGVATEPKDVGSADLAPASPIGMGLYLYRWNGWPDARRHVEQVADLAQRAGIKWSREEFSWGAIEYQRGQPVWEYYDDMVSIALKHGISVYGLLCYWSTWTKPYTPEGIDDYCRYVREVVHRYKDRIRHWEVWNEPNIAFWTGPKELYAQLLSRAYDTIKSEDPGAVVLGCSTAGIDKDFIRKIMDLGGKFDALTVHPYRAELNETTYISQLREVRELVGGRTVWITEIGFPTQLLTGCDERTQASLVARTYLASIASGAVANICWYDFRNDGGDPFYDEENFGLIRADFRPKPAYRAMATLGRTLAGLKMHRQVDVGPDAYALRFGDGKRDAVAVWSPNVSRLLTFEASSDVQVADAMGSPVRPARVGNRVTITLDAGFPVYITGQAGFAFEPAGCLRPIHVSRTYLHPGDETVIRPDAGVQVLEWQLPSGWIWPKGAADGTHIIIAPRDATPGKIEAQAIVEYGGAVRVPLELVIEPQLLRL